MEKFGQAEGVTLDSKTFPDWTFKLPIEISYSEEQAVERKDYPSE